MAIFTVFMVVLLIPTAGGIAYAGYNAAQRGDKRDVTRTPAFVQVPLSHYYVSRSQPVTLICGAENICDVQIKCGEEKFQDGRTRVCGKKCKGCRRRGEKRQISFDDIPKKTRSLSCQCKVWGTTAKTSNKSKVENAILRRKFGTVPLFYVVPINGSEILQCKPPSGSPKPHITWFKNGQQIVPRDHDKRMRVNITKDLVINRVVETDSGEYQCVAENIAGRREGPVLELCVRDNTSHPVCQDSNPPCINCSHCIDQNKEHHVGDCDSESYLLVVGTQDGLFTLNPKNTTSVTKIHSTKSVAVDFGVDTRSLYWSDTKGIHCFSLDNSLNKDQPFRHDDVSSIEGIAVDWVGAKLYWVDSKDNTIFIGDLQNGRQVALLNHDIDAPRAILVSPSKGYIYWTDWGRHPKIERARLDGTDRKVLIDSGVQFPNGLAYDEAENTLYWTDGEYGTIEAGASDGSNRTVVFNGSYHHYHPFGLDVYKDFIYWTDWNANSVLRIHKSGMGGVETIFSGFNRPMGIKILHFRKQPEDPLDPCTENNGGCEFLCLNLPSSRRHKCFCQHGYELRKGGKNCGEQVPGHGPTEEESSKTTFPTGLLWALMVVIIVLVLVLFGFVLYAIKNGFLRRSSKLAHTSRKRDQDERDSSLVIDQADFLNESANVAGEGSVAPSNNDYVEASARNGIVVYMTKVEVAQNGGVTVVGDEANIHYPTEV